MAQKIARVLFDFSSVGVQRIHTVVRGDTLSKIAAQYKTTVQKIRLDNNLTSDTIRLGQTLKV